MSYPPDHLPEYGERTVRLHLNEASYPAHPAVYAALSEVNLGAYPDGAYERLIGALGEHCGVEPWQVTVGNGSHELINLASLSATHLREVVLPSPTFYGHAKSVRMGGGTPIEVPVNAQGACDLPAMLDRIGPDTSMVILVSPNNPTGGANSADELQRFFAAVPEEVLIVIDEAYVEFSVASGGPDILPLLQARTGPWLVLRTFSKGFALAGLRLGFGVSNSGSLIESMNFFRGTFRVSAVAAQLGGVALAHPEYIDEQVSELVVRRDALRESVRALGYNVPASYTNFLVIVGGDVPRITAALEQDGVLAGTFTAADGAPCVRITVGSPADNARVVAALARAVEPAVQGRHSG